MMENNNVELLFEARSENASFYDLASNNNSTLLF